MPAASPFVIPVRPPALIGVGTRHELAAGVAALGERVLLVTDPGLVAAGVAGEVAGLLRAGGLAVTVWDAVVPNPRVSTVAAGAEALRRCGVAGRSQPVVVAVGGGSAIDTAKGAALAGPNPEREVVELDGTRSDLRPGAPLVAVPTTAGTGAETNAFGVIADDRPRGPGAGDGHEGHAKVYVGAPSVQPALAVLDPELGVGLPPGPTAACGLDVLVHAVECLQARTANPYSTALALEACREVVAWLPRAVADGSDLRARERMLAASHLAALAFGITGLGSAHALAHALAGHVDAPHGLALGAVLPEVVAHNVAAGRGAVSARIGEALGVGSDAAAVAPALDALAAGLGARPRLGELGLAQARVPAVARDARADPVIDNSPRVPEVAELEAILRSRL